MGFNSGFKELKRGSKRRTAVWVSKGTVIAIHVARAQVVWTYLTEQFERVRTVDV